MTKIAINTSKKYEVIIGNNIICSLGKEIKKIKENCKIMLVSDDIVDALYGQKVEQILTDAGFKVCKFCFANGEKSKRQQVLFDLLEALADNSFTRIDMLVALGGGVVGDLTGFAASIYMRGIDFVQVPTTLLAAVDSSVGGKTAVNLENGKNLAGTFWQPSLVLCDTEFLKTLPKDIFAGGMAEVIKYGVIYDKDLFEALENGQMEINPEEIICRCVEIKRDIVNDDEFDKGKRAILNFGHTIGHAIEKVSNFTISHGFAVGLGMVIISNASHKASFCPDINSRLIPLLEKYDIPTVCKFPTAEIEVAVMSDKKKEGDGVKLILPKDIGNCYIYNATTYELIKLIELGVN